ncbi:MAG: hypothetical protein EP320_17760 [Rhodobacteraceae bacterium]|nr:MAG: hypothetical protein EP320_17760 [Paracoccaceae bacterium]
MLLKLLREINDSEEIGGKRFESRFGLEPYDDAGLIGLGTTELEPSLRDRDRHLIYARDQNLLAFKVQRYSDRDEFFGGVVKITPEGLHYLEVNSRGWWRTQLAALKQNILTVILAVIVALASSWALKLLGPEGNTVTVPEKIEAK